MPTEVNETEVLDSMLTNDERAYQYAQEWKDIKDFHEKTAETTIEEDEYDWGWDDSNEILI